MTIDLYTAKQVSEVKSLLYAEQESKCALSKVTVNVKDCHTDHAHDSEQLVRGVLYKQANMGLGKLEGLWIRYLSYWYPGTLSDFLRQSADYLELPKDTRFRHVGWMKKVNTLFNQLREHQKDVVLQSLGVDKGENSKARKALFRKAVLSRKYSFEQLMKTLKE